MIAKSFLRLPTFCSKLTHLYRGVHNFKGFSSVTFNNTGEDNLDVAWKVDGSVRYGLCNQNVYGFAKVSKKDSDRKQKSKEKQQIKESIDDVSTIDLNKF